jgi:hypothetical protein
LRSFPQELPRRPDHCDNDSCCAASGSDHAARAQYPIPAALMNDRVVVPGHGGRRRAVHVICCRYKQRRGCEGNRSQVRASGPSYGSGPGHDAVIPIAVGHLGQMPVARPQIRLRRECFVCVRPRFRLAGTGTGTLVRQRRDLPLSSMRRPMRTRHTNRRYRFADGSARPSTMPATHCGLVATTRRSETSEYHAAQRDGKSRGSCSLPPRLPRRSTQ